MFYSYFENQNDIKSVFFPTRKHGIGKVDLPCTESVQEIELGAKQPSDSNVLVCRSVSGRARWEDVWKCEKDFFSMMPELYCNVN